jgi:hypothetical protein
MRTEHRGGVPESTAFAQTLTELKQEGCDLLVVGTATRETHAAASQHLLGGTAEPRRRLFVFTADADVRMSPPADPDPDTVRAVIQGDETSLPSGWPTDTVVGTVDSEPEPLAPLATAVSDAIDGFEATAGGLDPAELRVCFDSVGSLFRSYDPENVFRVLHLVTSRVRQVNGMAHFHLRLARDAERVSLLEPMFDATVELRVRDGVDQQRWHLRNCEVTSEWMTV